MGIQLIENTDFEHAEAYLLIEKEALNSIVIQSQVLSGSMIKKCHYKNVVFSDCSFYGCHFQDVIFDNCIFENCSFDFSHIQKSFFKNTSFSGCHWTASSLRRNKFVDGQIERNLLAIIENEQNEIIEKEESSILFFEFALAS